MVDVRKRNTVTVKKRSKYVHDGEPNQHAEYAKSNAGKVCLTFMLVLHWSSTFGDPAVEPSGNWIEQSKYDLETARAMLDSSRYLYVLFCCQQALEKILKAIIVKRSGDMPPRIHNLMRLAEKGQIVLSDERADFVRELSAYYIQTRYPEELAQLLSDVDEEMARRILEQAKELFSWLESILE
ncbi:MAG: HEPN domain-containing protein [Actinobacteria bacterium]|nr:HEPN domain-containing protein [Actinomycetota bacterium]MBU1942816.1 HEPN domain-containing protein [Actinomycetota bacterium]MBU2686138.1 HEPN domain-containing protein [Actinomycetota bacterium]